MMVLTFLKHLFKRRPKPSDYIGKFDQDIVQTVLAARALNGCLMWKKKKEELQTIRELDYDEQEIRRMP